MNQYQQQSQSYHAANYRGNVPGHDARFRSDSQNPSTYSFGAPVASQYRGVQRTFQPAGQVQSFYGQNQSAVARNVSSYGAQNQNLQSYHSANYKGSQPGHDAWKRSDSYQSSSFSSVSQTGNQSFGAGAQFRASQPALSQAQSPQSYHLANYQGNQPGHDAAKRSDSLQPSQQQYGGALPQQQYGYGASSLPQ